MANKTIAIVALLCLINAQVIMSHGGGHDQHKKKKGGNPKKKPSYPKDTLYPSPPPPPQYTPTPEAPKSPPSPTPAPPPPPPSPPSSNNSLQIGFYDGKCKINVEERIKQLVAGYKKDENIAAALARLMFHDCFVEGCDASILLDDGSGENEKDAGANGSVRGYDLIETIKAALETDCPGLVSCADIIVAATRDAVVAAGAKFFQVELGRRDGPTSLIQNVNLPSPDSKVEQAIKAFADRKLDVFDLVILLGCHTIGITHCSFIKNRLYNFNGSGKPDPNMDPALRDELRKKCPQNSNIDSPINLDSTPNKVDTIFYNELTEKKGILLIDQALALSTKTNGTVASLANGEFDFLTLIGEALMRLGRVGARTGSNGVIRKICSKPEPAI